ncbi:hypothetical protein KCP75_23550 [Salmonella enterica subsp. enterica]|nr:hypothetical protein KCP75_23550 [Salmonella enterica subsp. enterica]
MSIYDVSTREELNRVGVDTQCSAVGSRSSDRAGDPRHYQDTFSDLSTAITAVTWR